MRFPSTVTSLIARALADLKLPASQIADQLSGGQVAPAGPGSPGVIDLDAIPAISGDDPQALGAAAPGTTGDASDAGHVHPLPDAAAVGAEPALGNPGTDGYVLASLTGGTRLWVPQSGGAPLSDATPHAPGTAAPGIRTAASRDDHVHAPPTAAQIGDLLETTQDTVAAMIAAGANIGLAYNDSTGTLTISVSGVPGHASSHASGGGDPITPAAIGAVARAGDTMSGGLSVPELTIAGTDVLRLLPGTATSADRLDFIAQTPGRGGSFLVAPASGATFSKFSMSNDPSQSNFGSVFVAIYGDTAYLSAQNAGSPAISAQYLDIGGGAGATAWARVTVRSPLVTTSYMESVEITAPAAPAANAGRLFFRDNGSGKTQLCVIFATGSVIVLATQP
jgi:hypothetical protein